MDGDDPAHATKRARYTASGLHPTAQAETRFASRGEIGYCATSILRFCSFVRRLFIVTDAQTPTSLGPILAGRPEWHDRIEIVDHHAIYGEHSDLLPVFNSRSIETMIHRIPGVAEQFIYLNDDFFITRALEPGYFFRAGKPVLRGRMRSLESPAVRWLKAMLGTGPERAGFKAAQQSAARLAGRNTDYLLVGHYPHPMLRSTMAGFFADKSELLRMQAGARFRSPDQISPIGLANHLELARGAPVEPEGAIGFIKPPRRNRDRKMIAQTLQSVHRGALDALCVQSLNEMTEEDRLSICRELDRFFYAVHAGADQAFRRLA